MRDYPWFKAESVLCALVTLVPYDQQSPTRDLEPPYLLPCALPHYSLLLVLVFCEFGTTVRGRRGHLKSGVGLNKSKEVC